MKVQEKFLAKHGLRPRSNYAAYHYAYGFYVLYMIESMQLAEGKRELKDIRDIGICLPKTYDVTKHANCKGCLKAGKQHWYMVYCLWPDIFEEVIYTEAVVGYSIIRGYFLHELEPLFSAMKAEGIRPRDNECSAFFWVRVWQKLRL